MSQRTFNTVWRGRVVHILMGWDRPLQRFFLVIQGDNGLLCEQDLSSDFPGLVIDDFLAEEDLVYSNLSETNDSSLGYFQALLAHLEIDSPDSLEDDLIEDMNQDRGNHLHDYGEVASS